MSIPKCTTPKTVNNILGYSGRNYAIPREYLDLALKHLPARLRKRLQNAKTKEEYDKIINETVVFVVYYLSLIKTESKFNPRAQNASGAKGLAQLMPRTAKEIASRLGMKYFNLFNPSDSTKISIAYFADLYKDKVTFEKAVLAYKRGPYRTDHQINSPLWREVKSCADGALKHYQGTIETELRGRFSFVRPS
ncbi:transglycosylase SLT domain-containing protein [Candidatus Saganbacteria bacterium]|nr:transglycosylase SLT domain-containing protein [Candidatus Saganbacteria bacterium]